MSDDLAEIDNMINRHEKQEEMVNPSLSEEFKYLAGQVVFWIVGGLSTMFLSGLIWSIILEQSINFSFDYYWRKTVEVSFVFFVIFGIWAILSFYTGASVHRGEMMRRAWTNKKGFDGYYNDFRNFVTVTQFVVMFMVGSIIVVLVDYFFILPNSE